MASSSGNSSSCTKIQSSGSEGDLQVVTMDERKNKRKQSNRESARRSRMRKRDHLEDLRKQVSELRKENREIMATIDMTTQHYLKTEAENCVLRAQMGELNQRFQSLNDIIVDIINTNTSYERDCYYLTSSQNFTNTFCLNQPVFQWWIVWIWEEKKKNVECSFGFVGKSYAYYSRIVWSGRWVSKICGKGFMKGTHSSSTVSQLIN